MPPPLAPEELPEIVLFVTVTETTLEILPELKPPPLPLAALPEMVLLLTVSVPGRV